MNVPVVIDPTVKDRQVRITRRANYVKFRSVLDHVARSIDPCRAVDEEAIRILPKE